VSDEQRGETPEQLVERIYDEEFGLRPTNFQIKPVHVANGLVRSLTGRTYQATALAQTLRRWVLKQKTGVQEERFPNALILERYGVAFAGKDGLVPNEEALNAFRQLARDALGADDAVFADADQSSFTLANERFVTADPSDNRTGLFLARLLTAGSEGDAACCLRKLTSTENDPWTTLALPLLQLGEARDGSLKPDQAALAARAERLFRTDGSVLRSPVLRELRSAYDRLARFEASEGSKVNSLRRLVLFGCFAVHVHLVSRWSELVPGAPRPPIFPDMLEGARSAVLDASRATVRAAGDALEGLLVHRISEYVRQYDNDAELLRAMPNEQCRPNQQYRCMQRERVRARMEAYRDEAQPGTHNPLTDALLDVGLEDTNGHPVNFLTELGRRSGYMVPWANQGRGGKLQKRYSFTAEFLETLIGAVVEPDDPLDFQEFLQRLRDCFGVVVGRPQDDCVIRSNNLNDGQFGSPISVSEEDLRANVEGLRRLIVETGYAKTYADGQTIVTAAPEGLVAR